MRTHRKLVRRPIKSLFDYLLLLIFKNLVLLISLPKTISSQYHLHHNSRMMAIWSRTRCIVQLKNILHSQDARRNPALFGNMH